MFENFGLKVIAEITFPVKTGNARAHDPRPQGARQSGPRTRERNPLLEDAFHAVSRGQAESDGFNRLVLDAELPWRDVTILRAVAKFLRQAGFTFSQDYGAGAGAQSAIAAALVRLFQARNDPGDDKIATTREKQDRQRIDAALDEVPSLDDDRIIRRLRNVIVNVLRTNFLPARRRRAQPKPYVAIKLDSRRSSTNCRCRGRMVEIFVYSPEVEGVHLRFGKVARGGIRWSDRREDFRTEILGLVKAQQVKNAVIVPVGAKGGFYPKQLPPNAHARSGAGSRHRGLQDASSTRCST